MNILKKSTQVLILFACATSFNAIADANYARPSINESFRNGSAMLKYEMYEDALEYLHKADVEEPDNADINNLLGFSYRKLGRYEDAQRHYSKALQIDPKHRGAHEYLGELYLETGRLSKAENQLSLLGKVCKSRCKEYRKLKKAIKNHHQLGMRQ